MKGKKFNKNKLCRIAFDVEIETCSLKSISIFIDLFIYQKKLTKDSHVGVLHCLFKSKKTNGRKVIDEFLNYDIECNLELFVHTDKELGLAPLINIDF